MFIYILQRWELPFKISSRFSETEPDRALWSSARIIIIIIINLTGIFMPAWLAQRDNVGHTKYDVAPSSHRWLFVCVSCRRSRLLSAVIAGYLLKGQIFIRPAFREHVMVGLFFVRQTCWRDCLRLITSVWILFLKLQTVLWFWSRYIHKRSTLQNLWESCCWGSYSVCHTKSFMFSEISGKYGAFTLDPVE